MSKRLQDATADNIVRQFLVLRTSSKFCELSDSVLKLEKFRQARDNSASIVNVASTEVCVCGWETQVPFTW